MPHVQAKNEANQVKIDLQPIDKIAKKAGISDKFLELLGNYKAKVSLDILNSLKAKKNGKYILVTAITPTPLGEGKTVTTIGLSMALNKYGHKAISCIRQPSIGPVFGTKGGATGGGKSQVIPSTDINLHFTGDSYAVNTAHNLCASFIDNSIYRGNPFDLEFNTITWPRVTDINDRFLRNISTGLGTKSDGITRRTSFDITAASEIMAILALSENIDELRKRLKQIIIGYSKSGRPVTVEDLKVAGPMTALLRDALKPNLVQTTEHTPCFVHTGPFANVAHGSSSIVSDKIALKLADYVVTEAGFGADMGAEKFFNIKCRASGLAPDACVLVVSIRALKVHSGDFEVKDGKNLDTAMFRENVSAVQRGCSNLDKQIENVKLHGVPVIVCINKFDTDTEKELEAVRSCAMASGANACVISTLWQEGSIGGEKLAKTVVDVIKTTKTAFRFLYPLDIPVKDKVNRIARTIYGAKEVTYPEDVEERLKLFKKLKLDGLPVCMAKTQFSLSHEPKRKGRPRNFKLPVSSIHIANGAGYIYVLCGDIKTMPGLPKVPAGIKIDVDKLGNIVGLH